MNRKPDVCQAILSRIDERRRELIQLAQRLVQIKSDTLDGDERAVADFLTQRLGNMASGQVQTFAKAPNRPNLLARVQGRGPGPSLMLVAHTDTKPPGDLGQWTVDPYGAEIRDGVLYGRGSADMKGALAAMIVATEVLIEVGFPGDIQLLFVADEESGSAYGAKFLAYEVGLRADAAIIGEPCGIDEPWDYIHIAHRGVFCFRVEVLGTQMHSSMSDIRPSVNACVKLAEVLQRFARDFKPTAIPHKLYPQGATVNLAVLMRGGVHYGVYPGRAEFCCDVRIVPGMTRDQIVADIEQFVAQLRRDDPSLRINVDYSPRTELGWIEGMELPQDAPIAQALAHAAEAVLGRRVPFGGFPGGTDACNLYLGAGIPTIPAFGPGMLEVCHGPDESVPVEDIVRAAKVYALAAHEFLNMPHGVTKR